MFYTPEQMGKEIWNRRKFIKKSAGGVAAGIGALTFASFLSSCKKDMDLGDIHKYKLRIRDDYNSILELHLKDGGDIISHEDTFYSNNEISLYVVLKNAHDNDIKISIILYHNDVAVQTLSIGRRHASKIDLYDYSFSYKPKKDLSYNVEIYGEIKRIPDVAVTQIYCRSDVKHFNGVGSATITKHFKKNDVIETGIIMDTNACGPQTSSFFSVKLDGDLIEQVYNYSALSGYKYETTIYLWYY